MDPSELTTLYPTGDAQIVGDPVYGAVPALITDVDAATAAVLLAYQPPAFATDPTPFSDELEVAEMPHATIVAPEPAPTDALPSDAAASDAQADQETPPSA